MIDPVDAAVTRALERIKPVANELADKLVGHNALEIALLAAYCLRNYELAIAAAGKSVPRANSLVAISHLADTLPTLVLTVSRGN